MNDERKIVNIPIGEIVPNIYQPRIIFDNKSLEELSKSIKKYGIIQPLVLRKLSDKYEIIDGERRYKAAKKIGLDSVPAIVLDINDKEIAELILNENIQKQLLNPIEEANAYEQIMLLNRCSLEQLAKITGKDIKHIENKLNLLNLPPEVQEGLLNKKISESHARLLTKIDRTKDKLDLYNRIIKERLTIKEVEKIINSLMVTDYNSIKREKKVIDKFSLEELNNKDFISKQKGIKMEDKNMNDQNMNFNKYNGLLKEQEKPQMENNGVPEAILQGNMQGPKATDFFPSLEEQPLNIDMPTNVNGAMPMTPPPVDMSMPTPNDMPSLEGNQNVNNVPTLNNGLEMNMQNNIPNVQENNGLQMPEFNVINNTPVENNPINTANQGFEMPTLNNNTIESVVPTLNNGNEMNTQNNIPNIQENNGLQMPEFNVINNTPVENNPINTANQGFEMPTLNNSEANVNPTLNNGLDIQNSNPIQMPEFNIANNTLPENNTPTLEVLNQPFEMPTLNSNNIENVTPTLNNENNLNMQNSMPNMQPNNEMPVFNPINNNENNIQGKDLTSAIAILKDVLPLLNHAGFNVTLEESDVNQEHLVTFKIQK